MNTPLFLQPAQRISFLVNADALVGGRGIVTSYFIWTQECLI
jgi:hypothetical protein